MPPGFSSRAATSASSTVSPGMKRRTATFTNCRCVAWRWSQALREPASSRLRIGFIGRLPKVGSRGARGAKLPEGSARCSASVGAVGAERGHRAPCAAVNVRALPLDADRALVARWERFVETCPEATFFHRAAWREVLARTFGHAPHFLFAEDGGEIIGVLPLARQKSLVFGDALVSAPFCVYGGVATASETARAALERAAVDLGEALGVDHVEFRNRAPRRDDWVRLSMNSPFRKRIDPDPEKNLLAIPRKQRAEVRKGIERGLVAAAGDDADLAWELYAASV